VAVTDSAPNTTFPQTLRDMNRTQPLAIIESHCIQGGKVEAEVQIVGEE
jgi:hypothetical protein